jgi:hypothetical protein
MACITVRRFDDNDMWLRLPGCNIHTHTYNIYIHTHTHTHTHTHKHTYICIYIYPAAWGVLRDTNDEHIRIIFFGKR